MTAIGEPVRRREDYRFLTGQGTYTDDINRPGQLHAYILRSPHAHARIVSIETSAAGALDGVELILTAAELPVGGNFPQMTVPDAAFSAAFDLRVAEPLVPVLAARRIHYVGEPLAMVVATSRALAEDAVELIELEQRPVVLILD